MRLLVGSLDRILVGKSYHTKQKDGYSLPTNDPTNNHTNWILDLDEQKDIPKDRALVWPVGQSKAAVKPNISLSQNTLIS